MFHLSDSDDTEATPLLTQSYPVQGGDFLSGGSVSTKIKDLLKEIGLAPDVIRRSAICCYEAEMNVVMYAHHGMMTVEIYPRELVIRVEDEGRGIPDISLAMKEGYSTATEAMRERGFGAGMGLPNMKRNADRFQIKSGVGKGTHLRMAITIG
jgi:anti-sigma regulatory factor (Ser/Thr protein kinase)